MGLLNLFKRSSEYTYVPGDKIVPIQYRLDNKSRLYDVESVPVTSVSEDDMKTYFSDVICSTDGSTKYLFEKYHTYFVERSVIRKRCYFVEVSFLYHSLTFKDIDTGESETVYFREILNGTVQLYTAELYTALD